MGRPVSSPQKQPTKWAHRSRERYPWEGPSSAPAQRGRGFPTSQTSSPEEAHGPLMGQAVTSEPFLEAVSPPYVTQSPTFHTAWLLYL